MLSNIRLHRTPHYRSVRGFDRIDAVIEACAAGTTPTSSPMNPRLRAEWESLTRKNARRLRAIFSSYQLVTKMPTAFADSAERNV